MSNKRNLKGIFQKGWMLFALITMLLSGCVSPTPQPKPYRVGILAGVPSVAQVVEGFRTGMTDLGYIEGEDIFYDVQIVNFNIATYQSVLKKFVDDEVDLILVFPTEAALEAKTITQDTDIPFIFNFSLIEGVDLVESVRNPGGNFTGVRYPGPDMTVRRLEIMQQIVPDAKRIWLPYQKGTPIVPPQVEALRPLAEAAGITLIEFPASDPAEIQAELDKRASAEDPGMDAILTLTDPLVSRPDVAATIAQFASTYKIPLGGIHIETEALIFSLSVDPFQSGRLAAPLADKILKGVPAGTLPVVSPDYILIINHKRALELGLAVPEGLLKQADEVIR